MESSRPEPKNVDDQTELLSLLDEELNGLPQHFRAALVACELQGKSRREAAEELRVPEGTLSSHLARGRTLLRKRLVKRGISFAGVATLAGLSQSLANVTVPDRLSGATVRAALGYAAQGASSATVPASVAALVEAVFKMMFVARLSAVAATVTAVLMAMLTAAAAWAAFPTEPGKPPVAQVAPKTNSPAKRDTTTTGDANMAPIKSQGKLTLRAVSAETNEPIEGVDISYTVRLDKNAQAATVTTGEDGTAVIEWNPAATVQRLWFTAGKDSLVPIHILWDDKRHPVRLPETKVLRFAAGTTIGGIILDEAGQSVAGATVTIHSPPTEYEGSNYVFSLGEPKTDAQGRWRLDVAPKNLAEIWGRATHPHYRSSHIVLTRNLDDVVRLSKGLTVTGRVINAIGRPVKGAKVVIGHSVWESKQPDSVTDDDGQFTLENCTFGPEIVTVQADGFSPHIHDVQVAEPTPPLIIKLSEPAHLLRARFVDVHGKPIAGVRIGAGTWRSHRSIRFDATTNEDGRFQWPSAPEDVVHYYTGKGDYMRYSNLPLKASDGEQTIVLYPKLTLNGRVTDAQTGAPLPKFRLVKGRSVEWRNEIHWAENDGADVESDRYSVQFDEPSAALYLSVTAPGFKPAQSRAFKPSEGSQVFDFALERGASISGAVLLPDGKPAAGAEVALGTDMQEGQVSLRSGRFDPHKDFPKVTTGPDGRFAFPAPERPFVLVALSDAGYADITSSEFTKTAKLVLQPWGRIDGVVRIGPRAGVKQTLAFRSMRPASTGEYVFNYDYWTHSDERGRFQFNRVIPGPGTVSRTIYTDLSRGRNSTDGWHESVAVKPGQTVDVKIGGKGRPVIGRIVLDETPESPVDWIQNEPVMMIRVVPELPAAAPRVPIQFSAVIFASNIDKLGRFRIEDVPNGQFDLKANVNAAPDPRSQFPGTVIGTLSHPVNVPEMPGGRSNDPLDVGTMTAKLFDTLKIGDLAADFDVERIGSREKDQRLKLSDYRGKLVLLNFWDLSAGSKDMVAINEIHEAFGRDPRFVIISLFVGPSAEPADAYVKQNAFPWLNGFAGDSGGGVPARYKVESIPHRYSITPYDRRRWIPLTFLIAPDGRFLAHDLKEDDLEIVRKALANEKLFSPSTQSP
jgi:hypothetical protein